MSDLERFTVSMDKRLLERFDERNKEKGYTNRSEGIRDLVRNCLIEEQMKDKDEKVAATVTIVYDHHKRELSDSLIEIQHHHSNVVVAATHVHLDNENCLEVIILRGKCVEVKSIADMIIAQKGVKHGKIVLTTEGKDIW